MPSALASRLKKLENARSGQGPNRILLYDPINPNGMADALSSVGKGKYMLVANFGSMPEWEAGLLAQQRALLTEAGRRK